MGQRHKLWRVRFTLDRPHELLIGSFAGLIALGTALLLLPISYHPHVEMTVIDALFTATSAVCVTGLIVLDTQADFTCVGQAVILLLMQLGGLGLMTFALFAFHLLGRKLSLQSKALVQDALWQRNAATEFARGFRQIFFTVLAIECAGAILLFFMLPVEAAPSVGDAVFSAVFHAVSAFCNAGFSTYSTSMVEFRDHAGIMLVIAVLIVLGGLGHGVLHELAIAVRAWIKQRLDRRKHRLQVRAQTRKKDNTHRVSSNPLPSPATMAGLPRLSLHTRIVVGMTVILLFGGWVGLLVFGLTRADAADSLTPAQTAANAAFQSVTARTAGFNTIDIGAMPGPALFVLILLMYVGGSPGSCAGGIKTTSFAIWLAQIRARLRGSDEVVILDRRIRPEIVRRTLLLVSVSLFFNLVGLLVLISTEPETTAWRDIMVEQISAFATVGLSTGLTSQLSEAGRIWIIFTMFVGRLGPLTVAFFVVTPTPSAVRCPEGKVMIG